MSEEKEVLLYGLGAIGSFYAFILSRCTHVRLSVCARSNYDAVSQNGFVIDSENHGKHTVHPHKVLRTPAESLVKFDYIVCANKAIGQEETAQSLASVVDERRTTFVLVQNGVGNEEPFRKMFPNNVILSCVVWVGAIQRTPGIVNHTKSELTQIGLFPTRDLGRDAEKEILDEFSNLLIEGGSHIELVDDIQVARWKKVTWNCAWNSLTSLTMLDTQTWFRASPDAIPLSRQVMKEVIDVAQKCGVGLEHSLVDTLMDKILAMPPMLTSMMTDRRHDRPMEVEIILGVPVKKGRELGVPIPTLETMYAILSAINSQLIQSQT